MNNISLNKNTFLMLIPTDATKPLFLPAKYIEE